MTQHQYLYLYIKSIVTARTVHCVLALSLGQSQHVLTAWALAVNMSFAVTPFISHQLEGTSQRFFEFCVLSVLRAAAIYVS